MSIGSLASSLIKKRTCTIVFDCLSNNISELFDKYFEEMDHIHATIRFQ